MLGSDIDKSGGDTRFGDRELFRLLKRILFLANDLCLAYGTAIRRIDEDSIRETLIEMDKSHDRYRVELSDFICELGYDAPDTGGLHGVVERGRVIVADLSGDGAILRAMAKNEAELLAAYEEAAQQSGLPQKISEFLARAVLYEKTHRQYFDDALLSA